MTLRRRQRDHRHLLAQAKQMLGQPVRAFSMDWEVEQLIRRRAKLLRRIGLAGGAPIGELTTGRTGCETEIGLELFEIQAVDPALPIVRVVCFWPGNYCDPWYNFWAVATDRYDEFCTLARQRNRCAIRERPPVLEKRQQERLWSNTIGFLKRRAAVLKKYGVPQRRGVLLLGEPGNGKTMACRWLRHECSKKKLAWRTVSAEQYEDARGDGGCSKLFHLRSPGVIQFDDLDVYLRDREKNFATPDHTTFLTELDGVGIRHGVVYLFTSNAKLSDLDPAFLRPGRIDQVIDFPKPTATLRRVLIESNWHTDIQEAIHIDQVIEETEGRSFAELEELKKLLALRFFDDGVWDWSSALTAFHESRRGSTREKIGFKHHANGANGPSPVDRYAISAKDKQSVKKGTEAFKKS